MKSQDVLLLLKLVSLHQMERKSATSLEHAKAVNKHLDDWQGWEVDDESESFKLPKDLIERYSMRSLQGMTGISKSEISNVLKRLQEARLVILERKTNIPRVNRTALCEFMIHGFKYIFPATPGVIVRGIPTSFAAPVMEKELMTAGDNIMVWPDPTGKQKGQTIDPLFRSVPRAVKQDPFLYELLALADSLRTGRSRETKLAADMMGLRLSQ